MREKVSFPEIDRCFLAKFKSIQIVPGDPIESGENGATFIPAVSADGVISWTNDKGLDNPEPVNIKGERGAKGDKGDPGEPGQPGEPGKDGADGQPGRDGKDGAPGKDGADGYTPQKGVDYFDGQDGKDGIDGKDGYTPKKGVDYFDGKDGKDGADGQPGKDGEPGSQGKKGEKGDKGDTGATGAQGEQGIQGEPGKDGKDGVSVSVVSVNESTADGGSNIVTFSDGKTLTVKNGNQGAPGYTPRRGVDYFTEADKSGMIASVANACIAKNQGSANVGKILVVGTDGNLVLTDIPEGGASGDVTGTLDDSKNILLSGDLAIGTYTLAFENKDGSYTGSGMLEVKSIEPTKTNFFVVGGDGYLNPGRASSNGSDRTDVTLCLLSNYIDVQNGDEVYVYGAHSSNADVGLMALYTASTGVGFYVRNNTTYITNVSVSDEVDVFTINYADVTRMRVCCLIPSDLNTLKVNIKRNGEWL